jgi:hypothetical protein
VNRVDLAAEAFPLVCVGLAFVALALALAVKLYRSIFPARRDVLPRPTAAAMRDAQSDFRQSERTDARYI